MNQNRFYHNLNIANAVNRLQQFFGAQGHETQALTGNDITVLQAKKENALLTITGLASALTIRFAPEQTGTRVEIGMSKWMDKAAVGVVGLIAFFPLAVTAGIGFYQQQKLMGDVWRVLDDVAGVEGSWSEPSNYQPGGWKQELTCASCNAKLPSGVGFCARCGANVQQAPTCSACGVKNQAGARFCNGCGGRLS